MFYVVSKPFFICQVQIYSILHCRACPVETLRQTYWEWPTTDHFSKYLASSFVKSSGAKSSSDSSFKICHSSEFFGTLGIYSTRFLCGNCPLGFLFPINLSPWILHAVHMSCVLHDHSKRTEDAHHLSFFYSRRERSETMGSETTESSVDDGIYSTRFRCIFSSGFMSFSNWVL